MGTNKPGLFKQVMVVYDYPFRLMGPLKVVNKKLKERIQRL
jgi:hypothetical protein